MDKIKTGLTALMTGASLMMASNANCADGVTVDHLGETIPLCAWTAAGSFC
ncbi:hypothetical protein [Muribaculum intestinale]|uniref:hypothetical protein n=1 Tax=Muribaculum intestinale TaxID=1796646 RepID=UPI001C3F08A2|nr:hypothetical protein [Muribaculum intestinale]